MIIDFHSHIFPEKIAKKALPKLSGVIHIAPSTDGTINGMLASMKNAGVDISVILPTVTDPHQFDSILKFACYVNEYDYDGEGPRLISLAGIHPEASDYKEQLKLIKKYGFAGFKIHPDYQGTCFDDIRYMRILDKASELDLFCITHAGYDPYSPDKVHCTPEMIVKVVHEVAPTRLVAAHMGNNEFYDQAEKLLMGLPIYLDTAYSLQHMDSSQFIRMAKTHGTDRILFGSDAPWTSQKEDVELFLGLDAFTETEREQILSGNAKKLLNL